MDQSANSFGSMMRRPSAFLPIAMSLTALALLIAHIIAFGPGREADEGPTAHLWQLLMAGQIPVLLFFAVKWLPRAAKQSAVVLAIQAVAAAASVAPVLYLNL